MQIDGWQRLNAEYAAQLGVEQPKWAAPKLLDVDGKEIRIMAGPNGSIQGPAEAKWGYTTGSIADHRRYAVAIETATKLYGDPTVHSPVVRTVQSGAGLDVLENRGEWLRVRTLTQAEGWVESDAIGLL